MSVPANTTFIALQAAYNSACHEGLEYMAADIIKRYGVEDAKSLEDIPQPHWSAVVKELQRLIDRNAAKTDEEINRELYQDYLATRF